MGTRTSAAVGCGMPASRPFQACLATARMATCVATLAVAGGLAAAPQARLHVVVPAAPGGGLDGVAREVGRTLTDEGIAAHVSFENVSGGGGGRALAYFLDRADRFEAPLLVNSTPLLVRRLQGRFPFGFRDLTPVAALVADPGIFVVPAESSLATWPALLAKLRTTPREITFGGGSSRGSLDHIVLGLALAAAEIDPKTVRYLPYDGGGKAMLALLGGEVDVLSTGLGETIGFLQGGGARALAVTAADRVDAIDATPTLTELGYPVVFANWRGLFAPPDVSPRQLEAHLAMLRQLRRSGAWQATLKRRGWASLEHAGSEFEDFLAAQETQLATMLKRLGFLPSD